MPDFRPPPSLPRRLVASKQCEDGNVAKAGAFHKRLSLPAKSGIQPMNQKGNMNLKSSHSDFFNGLVFGFDVGTGSIADAVRKGAEFKDVGVLICDSEGSDLSKRRDLRRQRRTLRSKKYRRQWFAGELLKLGLPKPVQPPNDPITLRLRALNGEELKPEELHTALTHLFKRRGYSKVPWANVEKAAKETAKPKKDDDEGKVKEAVEGIRKEMKEKDCQFPCQLLDVRRKEAGKSPEKEWARKIYWPRDLLENRLAALRRFATEEKGRRDLPCLFQNHRSAQSRRAGSAVAAFRQPRPGLGFFSARR
jgi:hypothetical protein